MDDLMKFSILGATVFVLLFLPATVVNASTPDFDISKPVLPYLKEGSDGDMLSLEYSLKRCTGLMFAVGTAYAQLRNEPDNGQQFVDVGEGLASVLTQIQIKLTDKEDITQEKYQVRYRGNLADMMKFNRLYSLKIRPVLSETDDLSSFGYPISDDFVACVGTYEQFGG